ncbi:MAG: ComEC/Rec2 family competence protein [Patescibacteria group bacterium]
MKNLLWLVLFSLFVVRFVYTRPVYKQGDTVRITATVSSQPIRYTTSQYIKLVGLKTYLPAFPEISYGDKVVVEGLVKDDKLQNPKLLKVTPTNNVLYRLRQNLISFYKSAIPEPHASLVAGMVIGSKQAIPQDFMDNLKATGTAHVVVASGMNVTLVGGFILNSLTAIMKRRKALVVSLICIWIYALMAGFDAPIVRAAIMGTIAFTAQELGRLNYSLRALFLSGFVMLIINPSWISDLGFILSFMATLSLILFQTKIDRLIRFVPGILRQDLSTTIAAQVGVAPIIFYVFGQFNLLSPLYNVLVLWTIPFITIIGFVAGAIGLLIPGVGRLILWLAYPLTGWFNTVISI